MNASQTTKRFDVTIHKTAGKRLDFTYASVDADGTIRVFDDVAGHYTTCHGLNEATQDKVRAASLNYAAATNGVVAQAN
jgi:hypothetical protein